MKNERNDQPPRADRAEDAARLLQRLDQHGGLVTLSADAASVIRALLTDRQSLMERVRNLLTQKASHKCSEHKGPCQRAESAEALTVSLRAELEEAKRERDDNHAAAGMHAQRARELTAQVERLEREKATCPDHGPHVGCRYCPECYQRAFTAGQEAAIAASSPKEPSR